MRCWRFSKSSSPALLPRFQLMGTLLPGTAIFTGTPHGVGMAQNPPLWLKDGDEVSVGQVVALSGSTGRSTAPHLHFEIRRGGRSIDPRSVTLEDS